MQPMKAGDRRRGSLAVSLTQNNMIVEINRFNKPMINTINQVDLYNKAPAKQDPNNSLRRLSITSQNLESYNKLFGLGNIRRDQTERTINFTAGSGKMGDLASSTVTDLRNIM